MNYEGEKKEMDMKQAILAGISFGGTYAYLIFSSCGKERGQK